MADSTEAVAVDGYPGYQLVRSGSRGQWAQMRHNDCAKTVAFVNPRPERLDWYAGSHRCEGIGWQGYQ